MGVPLGVTDTGHHPLRAGRQDQEVLRGRAAQRDPSPRGSKKSAEVCVTLSKSCHEFWVQSVKLL